MEQLIPYINLLTGIGVFGWMIRAERRLAVIETTCKLKGGCADGGSEEDA